MKVRVTKLAENHLAEIHQYIAHERPITAEKVMVRPRSAFSLLGDHPFIGHQVEGSTLRRWIVPGLPYVIGYRVHDRSGEIAILTVRHGARKVRSA